MTIYLLYKILFSSLIYSRWMDPLRNFNERPDATKDFYTKANEYRIQNAAINSLDTKTHLILIGVST